MLCLIPHVASKSCRGSFRHAKIPERFENFKKGVLKMEILNLVLFGCVFYLAIIGIPTICERHGKG